MPLLNLDYPDLRIIVTSGYSEEDAGKGFPLGTIAAFVQKPYTAATLLEKVEESLNRGGPNGEAPAAG